MERRGQRPRQPGLNRLICLTLILALGISLFPAAPNLRGSQVRAESATDEEVQRDLQSPFIASLSMELNRYSTLHQYNASLEYPMPSAYPILMALLVTEELKPDQLVTISLAAEQRYQGSFDFQAGERFPVDLLLAAMLIDGSETAMLALAEAIDKPIVDSLNNLAKRYGLKNTKVNLSPESWPQDLEEREEAQKDPAMPYPVVSTLRDLVQLSRIFLERSKYRDFLGSSQYAYYKPPIRHLFRNPLSLAWGLTLDRSFMQGAMRTFYGDYCSTIYHCQHNGIEMIVVQLGNCRVADLQTFTETSLSAFIRRFDENRNRYELSPLVYAGDPVDRSITVEGRDIDLFYLESASYVHPRDDVYLEDAMELHLDEDLKLPIKGNEALGYATFTLVNTLRVNVPVGSMVDVYSSNPVLDEGLEHYHQNKLIYQLIFVLTLILIAWGIARAWRSGQRRSASAGASETEGPLLPMDTQEGPDGADAEKSSAEKEGTKASKE